MRSICVMKKKKIMREVLRRVLCILVLVCIAPAAFAQVDVTHVKAEGYDAYSVSSVNPADSSFTLNMIIEGDNISKDEVFDLIFSQMDSIMYIQMGDKYDDKAREETHKKIIKNSEKKLKQKEKERKKFARKTRKAFKKELRKISQD